MASLTRRRFLQTSGTFAAAAGALTALDACGGSDAGAGDTGRDYLTWWDHQGNQGNLHKQIFGAFAKRPGGMKVQYTFRPADKLGQALQLAKQSHQLPDIHTNAGLQIPVPELIAAGWVAPLDLSDAAMARLKGHLLDGVHIFDGKLYSFPQFNPRTYSSATWFNRKIVERAGLDPSKAPETYDEFRSAARKVQQATGNKIYGWVWNGGMPDRMDAQVNDLAQAAGFQGGGGTLYRTGEITYHADEYVHAIEFLVSMAKDKLLMPGSTTFSDQIARTRWVAGTAAYFVDGPWNPGVIRQDFPAFADSLGVGSILVPEAGMTPRCYAGPQGGVFWLSPSAPARQHKAANLLLGDYFTTKSYFTELAGWMPQPPLDLSAVEPSEAYPTWKALVKLMADQVFLAPSPVVRNVDVTKVQAETKQIRPTLGDITQGALSGNVTDIRGALRQLSDKSSAERERAVEAARAKGGKATLDDYAFADWRPGADYTTH